MNCLLKITVSLLLVYTLLIHFAKNWCSWLDVPLENVRISSTYLYYNDTCYLVRDENIIFCSKCDIKISAKRRLREGTHDSFNKFYVEV